MIAIIGGGASGMLTAVNLIGKQIPIEIAVFNSGEDFGTGVAYHSYSGDLLLNVMAGKVSAFPGQPAHFVNWLMDRKQFPDKAMLL